MSRAGHVRRRHAVARPHSWAIGPDTAACLFAVACAVLLVPLAMGGRHPLGQVFLSGAAIAAAVAWLLRCFSREATGWKLGPLELLFGGGLVIGLLQIIPLPAATIHAISPNLAGLLPCWTDGAWTLGRWETLSLTPSETLTGLAIFAAQAVFIGCVFQSIDSSEDVERILLVVAIATGLMAALGVVQYLTGNGKYLWFYEFAYNSTDGIVKGTFSNRNHYASFLAIGAGSLIWWTFAPATEQASHRVSLTTGRQRSSRRRRSQTPAEPNVPILPANYRLAIGLTALAVLAFAVLCSLSRGGAVSLAIAGTVATAMLVKAGRLTPGAAGGLLALALLVGAALTIHGMERVGTRLDTVWEELGGIFSEEDANLGGRREVWQAAVTTIGNFPVLGTGIGSHASVSPIVMPPTDKTLFTHAENSYLNVGVETGLAGLGLAIVSLLIGFGSCSIVFLRGNSREQIVAVALATGLTAGAVHACTDFIWYVPACSTLLMLLGACAVRLAIPHAENISLPTLPLDRLSAAGLTATAVMVLGFIGKGQLQAARAEVHFEEAIKQSRAVAKSSLEALSTQAAASFTEPKDDGTEQVAATASAEEQVLDELNQRISSLEQTVASRPSHPRAWVDLAVSRLERFGLARRVAGETFGLVEIRQTVEENSFDSAAASQQWVKSVTGEYYADLQQAGQAALNAVTLTPCAGEAWCALAAVAFLQEPSAALSRACINQALQVRPHDGQVLFEAAVQAELDGDTAESLRRYQQCFAECPSQRRRILSVLLPLMPATAACDLLEPDLAGLQMIDGLWSRHSPADAMRPVKEQRLAAAYAAAAEAIGNTRCSLLCEAASLERTLGNKTQAAATLAEAIEANPNHYAARLTHVDFAMAIGDADTAKRELDWCLLRRPDSQKLQGRLQRLKQLRVEQASRPPALDLSTGSPGERR